ncbi:thiopeptide-type bacteriocin biosynthesis protein [Fulvivirga maritima]|uniref:thiopeptide-type bacteriocin biosynthesis protein n=1 Tax=Fulvivirga maritima TaxID=2904247 RepID=UPI001F25DEBE|nr:thiopeptide-type bacteriocin biosynthesis protein [Fulvivirga maritima]UII26791.1 thiopeptide-type bacteriocin biosynthesis protein [Fulvivirga maritima]
MLTKWLSYHIYTDLDRNTVLTEHVAYLINHLEANNLLRQYFYIRYNEGGPHIRLRLKVEKSNQPKVSFELKNCFNSDDFNVQEQIYQQETSRYGGQISALVCEEHFQLSSETCLYALTLPSNVLSKALILHYTMMRSYICEHKALIKLFHSYMTHWFAHSHLAEANKTTNELINTYFEPRYQSMKNISFFQNLEKMVLGTKPHATDWLSKWVRGNKHTLNHLNGCLDDKSFFSVLESLIHMTNNRLGVYNYDEAFLAFLLKRTIEDLSHHEQSS